MFEKTKTAGTVLFALWLATIIAKKITENCYFVGVGAQLSIWPNFDPIFLIFRVREKGKLYILKQVDLSTFKEININMSITALS